MSHDENEMLVEFGEMTAFNFNSKEYQEVQKDLQKCKEAATCFERILQSFVSRFRPDAV